MSCVAIIHKYETIYEESNIYCSKSWSLQLRSLTSRIGALIDPLLLLTINRKPLMPLPMAPLNLALSDLESQGHLRFSRRSRVRPYVTIKH